MFKSLKKKIKGFFNTEYKEVNIPVEKRVSELERMFFAFSQMKLDELKTKINLKQIGQDEIENALVFRDLVLNSEEKKLLLLDDYSPIVTRFQQLNKNGFHKEVMLLGTLFITGEKGNKYIYQNGLKMQHHTFINVLYFYCISLLQTDRKELCQVYIDLLQKLMIVNPSIENPPQELVDKLGYRAYSKVY